MHKVVFWSDDDLEFIARRLGTSSATGDDPRRRGSLPAPPPPLLSPAKAADDGKAISFVISTGSVDRQGDTVNVDGWHTRSYLKNPVVLWSHDYSLPPIGKATAIWRDGPSLKATVQFASTGFAQNVKGLVKERMLSATSVGFRPLRWEFSKDRTRGGGIDFHEQELLEFSIVTVPANSEATISLTAAQIEQQRAAARRNRELEVIRLKCGV
jgi:HK97 family phage prohead protease